MENKHLKEKLITITEQTNNVPLFKFPYTPIHSCIIKISSLEATFLKFS